MSSYTLVNSQVSTGSVNTITFSSLPNTFRDFIVSIQAGSASNTSLHWRINGDSATNYNFVLMERDPSFGVRSQAALNTTQYIIGNLTNTLRTHGEIHLLDVNVTNKFKSGIARVEEIITERTQIRGWTYASNNAITSLSFFTANGSNFVNGSSFSVYGIGA